MIRCNHVRHALFITSQLDGVIHTSLYGRRDRAAEVCTEAPNYSLYNYFGGKAVSLVLLSIGLH